jgi:hypothetical protein
MEVELNKAEYEAHVLGLLKDRLLGKDPRIEGDGTLKVEDVRLNTREGPYHLIEVFIRDSTRPECLFGWQFPATEADVEDDPTPWAGVPGGRGPEQAEVWAHAFALTRLQEQLEAEGYGLPDKCEPSDAGITWISDRPGYLVRR